MLGEAAEPRPRLARRLDQRIERALASATARRRAAPRGCRSWRRSAARARARSTSASSSMRWHWAGSGTRDSEIGRNARGLGLVELARAARAARAGRSGGMIVLVGDRQRMVGQRHVEPGERAPAAADQVEGPALGRAVEAGGARPPCATFLAKAASPFAASASRRSTPSGSERAAPTLPPRHLDQLEAAAAEIADDAVGVGNGGEHALPRQLAFLLARQHFAARSRAARPASRKAAPFEASRTAAVATTRVRTTLHLPDQESEALERGERARLAPRAPIRSRRARGRARPAPSR